MIDARTGKPTLPPGPLETYDQGEFFCEMFGRNGLSHTRRIREHLASMDIATLRRRSKDAERELFNLGITFTVYTDRDAIDRILPFDVIPRVLSKKDWGTIESGVKQRVAALNLFLHDIYHDGNSVAVASFNEMADTLHFESQIVLDRYPLDTPEFPIEEYARQIPFSYPASEVPDLGRTIERHYPDPERRVTEWTRRFLGNGAGGIDTEGFLISVTQAIQNEFDYEARYEPGVQTPVETLDRGSGTCRDYALFMMEAVRSVGLAARFVSGYLYDPSIDGGTGEVTGAGATHAWVQVYLPGAGWVEFDPTNGSHGGHNLVPIAVAREPQQAIPVSGSYDGVAEDFLSMYVDVQVHALQVFDQSA